MVIFHSYVKLPEGIHEVSSFVGAPLRRLHFGDVRWIFLRKIHLGIVSYPWRISKNPNHHHHHPNIFPNLPHMSHSFPIPSGKRLQFANWKMTQLKSWIYPLNIVIFHSYEGMSHIFPCHGRGDDWSPGGLALGGAGCSRRYLRPLGSLAACRGELVTELSTGNVYPNLGLL